MTNTAALADIDLYIDQHRDEFLETLKTLVRQPSISAQNIGVDECAELERRLMVESGLQARLVQTDGKPIVYGELVRDPDAPTILIYGHYDVQPPDPVDLWESAPFEPTVRNGRIYGRGTGDNKGQHLAQLLAIKAHLAVRGRLPVNVKVILEGEEESASPHLAMFVRDNRQLLECDLVYTSDGRVHESGRGLMVFGVRGTLQLEIVVRGADRDMHSGHGGGVVPNAAWLMVELLRTMLHEDGGVAIEGFYDQVRSLSDAERAAIADLPLDMPQWLAGLGLKGMARPAGPTYHERIMGLPSLSICGIHSGYDGDRFKTVIPSVAHAKIDIRLVPEQDPDTMFGIVEKHVRRYAPDAELIRHGAMWPSRTDITHPISKIVAESVAAVDGEPPLLVPSSGGSLPDYVFTKILGVPSFMVPYANYDEQNHAPNENLELERFYRGIRVCSSVLAGLASLERAAREIN